MSQVHRANRKGNLLSVSMPRASLQYSRAENGNLSVMRYSAVAAVIEAEMKVAAYENALIDVVKRSIQKKIGILPSKAVIRFRDATESVYVENVCRRYSITTAHLLYRLKLKSGRWSASEYYIGVDVSDSGEPDIGWLSKEPTP